MAETIETNYSEKIDELINNAMGYEDLKTNGTNQEIRDQWETLTRMHTDLLSDLDIRNEVRLLIKQIRMRISLTQGPLF